MGSATSYSKNGNFNFPDGRISGAILAACKVHGDIKLGEHKAQRLLELEPDNI